MLASQVYAQEEVSPGDITMGAKVGGNVTYLWGQGSNIGTITPFPGIQIGGYLRYSLLDKISIQPELLFSTRGIHVRRYYDSERTDFSTTSPQLPTSGYTVNGSYSYRTKVNLFYLDLPVMVNYQITDNLKVHAGPVVSLNVWDSYPKTYTHDNVRIQSDQEFRKIKPWEFGAGLGVSYDFILMEKKVSAGARYTLGLTRINEANRANSDLKSSTFSLSLAYDLYKI